MHCSSIDSRYSFEISGASYAGAPHDDSVMFIGSKVAYLVDNLKNANHCLVFVDISIPVPDDLKQDNCFVSCVNPSGEYVKVANVLWQEREEKNKNRKYKEMNGSWFGENIKIGQDVTIQPGCFIDHDVVLGDETIVLSGARISQAKIGKRCIIKQNAVIGGFGFTMAKDEDGNNIRIPSLGSVVIGDDVEIGSFTTVCRGTGNDTIIQNHVKFDDHVHVSHDILIEDNCEITAGVILGGYCHLEKSIFVGINSALRNRISIGAGSFIGMGAVVTKSFGSGVTLIGNPAHIMEKK